MTLPIKNILLVDDEKEFVQSVSRHLRMEGFFVETSHDGIHAQEMIHQRSTKRKPFDLVITDINMPKLGGLELLNWIKKNQTNLSVLIITGFGVTDYVKNSIRPNWDGYFQKTITPAEMLELIDSISKHRMEQKAS